MFTKSLVARLFSIVLVVSFLLTGVLPAQAKAPASPQFSSGDFLWAKSIGGSSTDIGNGIAIDSVGNVYTTGYFYGTVDFDPGAGTANLTSAGGSDIFVSKLDSSGGFVWAKSLGGTGGMMDDEQGCDIAVDSTGNVYTTGMYTATADFDPGAGTANLTSAGSSDIFVSKLDSNGDFVWAKGLGGTSNDKGNSIALDSSNNVFTTGSFKNIVDFDPGAGTANLTGAGGIDIFVSKLDSNGDFVWAKGLGGTLNQEGKGIVVDSSGNVFTTGNFQSTVDFDPGVGITNLTSAGLVDIFVSKLDSNGDFVWAKSIGGLAFDNVKSIVLDSSGNVFTTGEFWSTLDFDPGAGTANLTSLGESDVFVSKLDGNGDFIWAKSLGGAGSSPGQNDEGNGIAIDSDDNVYTTGSFVGTADFDPGAGTANLTSVGGSDIFVSKLDNSGGFVWAKSMGGTGYDYSISVALDSNSNVFTTGYFLSTADFDPGAGTTNLTSAGGNDIFISKLGDDIAAPAVGAFTATSPSTSLDIPITAFTASDNVGVTGYIITASSTAPAAGDSGWSGTAPATYAVGSDGSYTLYPWAKDAAGNVSVVFGSPVSVTVDSTAPMVDSFNTTPLSASFNIPITAFTASDNTGVTGYLISGTSTPPAAGDSGWSGAAPSTHTVGSDGGYTLYPWVKDAAGNVSTVFGSPASVTVDSTAPTVTSVVRANPSPTSAASVNFTVTFSEAVTVVDVTDFSLTASGINGPSIISVGGSGATRTVSVNTGTGNGTIRLDVLDDNTIQDAAGNPLDGPFSGEIYAIDKTITLTLTSTGAQDGWVLESTETSGIGATLNNAAASFNLGDDALKKQYRAILSFGTGAGLPDSAHITGVTLKIRKSAIVGGGNPLTTFQGFMLDIRKGFFGTTAALQTGDFNALANIMSLGPYKPVPLSNWYSIDLTSQQGYINKLAAGSGLTQFRLRFKLDDNNNAVANYLTLFSGNAPAANRPQLVIKYYIP